MKQSNTLLLQRPLFDDFPPPPPKVVEKPVPVTRSRYRKPWELEEPPEDAYPYYLEHADPNFPARCRRTWPVEEVLGWKVDGHRRVKGKHGDLYVALRVMQMGGRTDDRRGVAQFETAYPAYHGAIDEHSWHHYKSRFDWFEWVWHDRGVVYCCPRGRMERLGRPAVTAYDRLILRETGEHTARWCVPLAAFDLRREDGSYEPHSME